MANKNLNEINFKFEGAEYKLRPSFSALCEIEDRADETIPIMIANLQTRKTLKAKQLCAIIYGGLKGGQSFDIPFDEFCERLIGDGLSSAMVTYQNAAVQFLASCLLGRQEKKTESALKPIPSNE